MTAPLAVRLLTEAEQMLADILTPSDCHRCHTRYHHAAHRLEDVLPGWPSTVPGAGTPGAGKGMTASTVAERVDLSREHGYHALNLLTESPQACHTAACWLWGGLGYGDCPLRFHNRTEALTEARIIIRYVLAVPDGIVVGDARAVHRSVSELHAVVQRWGTDPPKPRSVRREVLAEDPTEMWCRNCLTSGIRNPRWRKEFCRFCYEFQCGEGFLPPASLVEAKNRGRVTEAMVAPHRKRHRDQQQQQQRRKRRRR